MKMKKCIVSLLMIAILVIKSGTLAEAASSSVSYEGGAEKYVFLPGSEYTDSDLFDNFKGVMPGDTLQQIITVQNDSDNSDYVKIYMRAETHDDAGNPLSDNVAAETEIVSMQEFLGQLSMTVRKGDEVIFEASPDELDGLSENILLGEYEPGESSELIVELSVPIELRNEYMNHVGEIDWVFMVEELERAQTTVKTGDDSAAMIYIGCGSIAILVMIGMIVLKRKSE